MERKISGILLILLFFLGWALTPFPGQGEAFGFLSDRAAGITGVALIRLPGLLLPEGLDGKGERIGLADSGLDTGNPGDLHPDLMDPGSPIPKVLMLRSWAGREKADDPLGHGTHLAGLLVGSGSLSQGQFRGLAPGAHLYFQGLLDPQGRLSPPQNLEELFRPPYGAGVRIHVNAWGSKGNYYSPYARQVDSFMWEHPDFLVVFGAGNHGPAPGTLTPEANSKNALVVGASQSVRPGYSPEAVDARRWADLSSRGPAGDGRLKPDILAPGTGLVGPCSRLVAGNFPPNPGYRVMGGTSQAAAVAGGSAALLRQYLREQGFPQPSAALLKAALVEGAWVPPSGPSSDFPGLLDLASTLLSLKEGAVKIMDHPGLVSGETVSFTFEVKDTTRPFRATLFWTDPPPEDLQSGVLVNDLDLVVVDPQGREFWGNDFSGSGQPDRRNNGEKVYIAHPLPGTYTVKVHAFKVTGRQAFALAYGQPLIQDTVVEVGGGEVLLASGRSFPLSKTQAYIAGEGKAQPLPGAAAYGGEGLLYVLAQKYQGVGLEYLHLEEGSLVLEINPKAREGGYFLAPGGAFTWNGQSFSPSGPGASLPLGFSLQGVVNPGTQVLWRGEFSHREMEGVLEALDVERGLLKLYHQDPLPYHPQAAVVFSDQLREGDPLDYPLGAPAPLQVSSLVPGLPLKLALDHQGRISYVGVKRELALGTLTRLEGHRLQLSSGRAYECLPGISVEKDGQPASLFHIGPGDWLLLNILPGSNQVLKLSAYSRVLYGKILWAGEQGRYLYISDNANNYRVLELGGSTPVFRWGLLVDPSLLKPGDWVRVCLPQEGERPLRLDAFPSVGQDLSLVGRFSGPAQKLSLANGQDYRLSPYSLVTLNGYRVDVQALAPGLPVVVDWVEGPQGPVLLRAAAQAPPAPPPDLEVSLLPSPGGCYLVGRTQARLLYVNFPDGHQEVVVPQGGIFQRFLSRAGGTIQIVALGFDGGIDSRTLDLVQDLGFWDIKGHWAEEVIRQAASRGYLKGYEDGSFRPDQPLTRAELVVLLVRLAGWPVEGDKTPAFKDLQEIPLWARATLAVAQEKGLAVGYGDGTFRPAAPVNRLEAAAFLARYLEMSGRSLSPSPPPFRDWQQIPSWAQRAVAQVYAQGLMLGVSPELFSPFSPFTRAQAAAVLTRME